MRLVFAGTPDAAVPSLRVLAASAHDVAAVVTRTDAPLGRKRVLTPSSVAQAATDLGLPVVKTDRLDDAATAEIARLAPDLGVIVAYGGLVREPLLSTPRHGWINLHFSLLPAWRGAAPVQRALVAGDSVIGAGVFQLVAALDAGDVFDEIRYRVPPLATADRVLADLAEQGAELLHRVVDQIAAGTARAVPQSGEPTYAPKLTAEDGRLDWTRPADEILARWRGTTPEPGAFTTLEGARVKVIELHRADAESALAPGRLALDGSAIRVGTGTDPLVLARVQPAGKSAMAAGDWYRGIRSAEPVVGS
ncbi:methionyl-tRNA formyltransferase [Microbacterium sp. cx-55]|uniref:methionyl-tRNA formyltransferase n=1 Tax=Microbacterium sp. cx-55 TaxID=2875948 RepID=UPI001CBE94E8|nr:methionyl-tRNA formyltransferase [Microbacterium sp. cx-55]MBZ4486407.1 methionyl-tRNA formyltransferase [Microbacterium sp. cx-55]UGB36619.1 methionyl-tRNA formyltransferase [Microbacterium sp. cx-55]